MRIAIRLRTLRHALLLTATLPMWSSCLPRHSAHAITKPVHPSRHLNICSAGSINQFTLLPSPHKDSAPRLVFPGATHLRRQQAQNRLPQRTGSRTLTMASSGNSGAPTDGTGFVVAYVTVPNQEVADNLSSSLVDAHLAACVNILPGVTSVYRWQGKVERDSELLLIIKTRESLLDQLVSHVKANHPYDVPEVITLPILGGSPAYLQWLADNTQHTPAVTGTTSSTQA